MASSGQLSPEMAAENKGPGILAACYTVEAIASFFVAARLFVRGRMMGKWQLDDWLIIVSMLFGWIAVAFTTAAVATGSGKHFEVLTESQHSKAIFWTVMGFGPGVMSFGIPKLAVVAFLTHIMNPSRIHRIILWGMASLCVFNLFLCVVFHFAQCTPAASQWDFSLERKCWSPWILIWWATWSGYFSAFLDLYLAVYPSIVLYKLQMTRKKKVALCGALGIGSISTVVAIYKTTRLPSLASGDFTFSTSDLVVFTIAEGATIIIAACIPVLQPLLEMITGKRGWLSSGRTSGGRPYQQHYGRGQSYMAEKSVRSEFEPRRTQRRLEDDDDLLMTSMDLERANNKDGFWAAGQPPMPRKAALPSTPSRQSSRASIRVHPKATTHTTRGIFSRPRRSEESKAVPPVITKTNSIRVEYEPNTGEQGSWPLPQNPFPLGDDAGHDGVSSGLVNQRSFSLSSVKSQAHPLSSLPASQPAWERLKGRPVDVGSPGTFQCPASAAPQNMSPRRHLLPSALVLSALMFTANNTPACLALHHPHHESLVLATLQNTLVGQTRPKRLLNSSIRIIDIIMQQQGYPPQGYPPPPQGYPPQEYSQQQQYPPQGYGPPPPQDQQYGYSQPPPGPPNNGGYGNEKIPFEQAFKIEQPKYNDIWAGILFVLTMAGYVVVSGIAIQGYAATRSSNGTGIYNGNSRDISINTNTLLLFVFCLCVAIVFSYGYVMLARALPKQLIWATGILNIVWGLGTAIYMLYRKYYAGGIVFLIFVVFLIFAFISWIPRIPFSALMLRTAINVANHHGHVYMVSFTGGLIGAAFAAWFAVTFVAVYVKFAPSNENPACSTGAGGCSYAKVGGLIAFITFCSYWFSEWLKNTIHTTVSGVYGSWYFNSRAYPTGVTRGALRRSLTYSFGSISLGSLIVAIVNFLRMLAQTARDQSGQSGDMIAYIFFCVLSCLISILQWVIEFVNRYAFSHIALYGRPYFQSAKDTWKMIKDRGIDALVNECLIGPVFSFGATFIGFATALLAFLYLEFTDPAYNSNGQYTVVIVAFAFLIGLQICNIFTTPLSSGIDTIFVASAWDPEVMIRDHGDLYHQMVQVYPHVQQAIHA